VVVASVLALSFALSAVATLNVLPPSSPCHPIANESKSIDGRAYCFATVPWPTSGRPSGYMEWGFEFEVWYGTSTFFVLPFTVTEPTNGTIHGTIQCNGPCTVGYSACYYQPPGYFPTTCKPVENESSPAWLTPDNDAGVMFSVAHQGLPGNLTLLVEA